MGAINEILTELKRLNTAQPITNETLWDIGDVASYLKLSVKYLQNKRITEKSGFPRALLLPLSDERPAKRWKAKEVCAWAQRIRG